jgi:antitoxin CptB
MTIEADTLDVRRRRLLWRATHRGTREMDILLGGFTRAKVSRMAASDLDELEAIIALPDPDLTDWLVRREPVPPEHHSATLTALLAFRP